MNSVIQFLRWPIVCGLLAAIIILDHFPTLFSDITSSDQHQVTDINAVPAQTPEPYSYAEAFNRAAPAVVNIYTSKKVKQQIPARVTNPLLRRMLEEKNIRLKLIRERIERSLGSGVIISKEGYLLTNNHVIEGAVEILVRLKDDREALAEVVGIHQETDLAVLKINLDNLNAIPIGDPSQAMIGDVVLAIGNAYGFGHTLTQGIISATGRYGLNASLYENYIQTDAAINPGNSGGALIDAKGNLLGINTVVISKDGGSQGIGLAIPSDLAVGIMSDLVMHGKVIRGWLGIDVNSLSLSPDLAIANNLSDDNGMVVTYTYPDGPADQSGLKSGDIITQINDRPVGDGRAAMDFIENSRPGEKVSIHLIRDGKELYVTAVLGSRPQTDEWQNKSN